VTSGARSLRVLLVANDGFSAGHVMRAIAIARGLARAASRRGIAIGAVLATTSQAHALLAAEPLAIVALPAPAAARRAGLSDAERRRLVRAALAGAVEGFGPDLIVVDTFPSGPHGELAGLADLGHRARRALVRRSVPDARDEALLAGLGGYDLAILAGDPVPQRVELPIAALHVPPITLVEPADALDRPAARAALGLPDGRAILVAAGGGGDPEAVARATAIAGAILRVAPDVTPVLALGPLAPDEAMRDAGFRPIDAAPDVARFAPRHRAPDEATPGANLRASGATPEPPALAARSSAQGQAVRGSQLRVLRTAPLAQLLAAFDGAFTPAGYNTAHELAKAGIPAALFARPRPFDDQAARAARFVAAGFACGLSGTADDHVAAALAWMATARVPALETGGADRAAEALLDLATGARAG